MRQETKLVKRFDKDGDKLLNAEERKAARKYMQERGNERGPGPGGRRGGFGPGGFGESAEPAKPGMKIAVADVTPVTNAAAYDETVLRTFFLEFEDSDWEKELSDFYNTDVEVPARVTVDGKTYKDVGVHFRGMSSFMMVSEGRKRSLNLSFDWKNEAQNLCGYRSFNLLNAHEDPSFIRAALYFHIARAYIPAPKANFVRVVINGENWGIYCSAQQFNKDFTRDFFDTAQGARWKVPGSPGGKAGLEYLGEDIDQYKRLYDIKSKDSAESWRALIRLCKVLNETPTDKLEDALRPILDIDGTLKFLALEVALINNDGYWVRASDYSLYLDPKGQFHLVPHDANETFMSAGGPGFGGPMGRGGFRGPPGEQSLGTNGPAGRGDLAGLPRGQGRGPAGSDGFRGPGAMQRGGGIELDPLVGLDDPSKPLRSKLLAVPALKSRYLGYVKQIAQEWLDWEKLSPVANQYQALIASEVKADTKKLSSNQEFDASLTGIGATQATEQPRRGPGGPRVSIKAFADQRRAYLLKATAQGSADIAK